MFTKLKLRVRLLRSKLELMRLEREEKAITQEIDGCFVRWDMISKQIEFLEEQKECCAECHDVILNNVEYYQRALKGKF